MRAMVLEAPGRRLEPRDVPAPAPPAGGVLLRVHACAVCRTDLHIVDGELAEPKLPLVPGHQIVATVSADGARFKRGDRVGVPWLGWTDGECRYCASGRENLCDRARFTGYDRDGGSRSTPSRTSATAFRCRTAFRTSRRPRSCAPA